MSIDCLAMAKEVGTGAVLLGEAKALHYRPPGLDRLLETFDQNNALDIYCLERTMRRAREFDRIMSAHRGDPSGVEFKHRSLNIYAFICVDCSEAEKFRIQYFDSRGFAGHSVYATVAEAVEVLVSEGYLIEMPGVLDQFSVTQQWQEGMAFLEALANMLRSRTPGAAPH